VVREQQPAELLGARRGLEVALGRGDDRALHQDVPLTGEAVGVLDARLLGEAGDERADVGEVADRGLPDRVGDVVDLEHHVDERAALEPLLGEPAGERVEDREQALGGRRAAALGLGLQPGARPQLVAALEEREDQVVLRGEVAVERHLRDAALGDDPVDADRARPVPAEQVVRRVEDPFACGRPSARGRFRCHSHRRGWYWPVSRKHSAFTVRFQTHALACPR
jgi:hypothetical protein